MSVTKVCSFGCYGHFLVRIQDVEIISTSTFTLLQICRTCLLCPVDIFDVSAKKNDRASPCVKTPLLRHAGCVKDFILVQDSVMHCVHAPLSGQDVLRSPVGEF